MSHRDTQSDEEDDIAVGTNCSSICDASMSSTNKSREKYSDARLNSDEFNDTFIHICLYIDTDPDRARQLETGGDEEDDVAGYFIRAVGACPPVTLNHHSHCRPYKLKLHLPLPPPSPFLLPLHPSPFTKLHLPSLIFPTNSYCSDILQIETTSTFPNFSLPFQKTLSTTM